MISSNNAMPMIPPSAAVASDHRGGESYDQVHTRRIGINTCSGKSSAGPGTGHARCFKITCDQYNAYKVTNPQNIAIWVNGYYHGKRGDVTLDTQRLVESARKLRDYCRRNRQTLVLEAVETLFAKER